MPNLEGAFLSRDGKRQVLIVDDEFINRELLGAMLEDEYELLFADSGEKAMEIISSARQMLSLVMLDLLLPGISGMDVLKWMREDAERQRIPVIVMTSEQSAEVESLRIGASDFISKPFSKPEVIRARVFRVIELSEDQQIIKATERDSLTGLYNLDYFYRYAEQYDSRHAQAEMDAIIVDVNHFHMINERYGRAYGNEVLCRIGSRLREMVVGNGGMVCRRSGDTFFVYCPHGRDYRDFLDSVSTGLAGDGVISDSRVRLRMGVYENADKALDVERRFDRAKMAADTVRNSFTKTIGIYDSRLHEEEVFSEQLLEDFPRAIEERQFCVYYQPKYDVRGEIPALASAEALIRWKHPALGMISPGKFIPLFEKNGLIQQLDHYVWREAAATIRSWKEQYGISVPVSVNVSRVDMYDPELINIFDGLRLEYGLEPHEYLLEITESAYTENSSQIISTVEGLRARGFLVEMDDFGTGYSSLSMISRLPIDALKLDMTFVRNAFNERKDIRMLELILEIAENMKVTTIAEGVETEEQMLKLKEMGCDVVQGYYFSKPVPPEEFAAFVEKEQQRRAEAAAAGVANYPADFFKAMYISREENSVLWVREENGPYVPLSCSREFAEMMGCTQGEYLAAETNNPLGTVMEEDRRDAADLLINGKTKDGRRHAIIWMHTLKGKIICVDMRCAFFYNGGKDYVYCSYYNVTSLMPVPGNDPRTNKAEEQK